uniref:Complement C3 n=1 Tax=Anas platyrhynchos TaxID=8839 RepID=A0A8B9TH75_ANAPL
MGPRVLPLILLLLHAAPAPAQMVTMVTPALLRLETEEQVVLEAPGLSVPTEATILVQDFPQKRQVLHQVRRQLNATHGMMTTATIKVCHLPACHLPVVGKQYVAVTARVGAVTVEKVLLVSLQSGHIFLQTDKPIYTPGSTGPSRGGDTATHLTIPNPTSPQTPDNVIIKQVPVSSPKKNGIFSLNHNLPEVVSLGTWTIIAKFEDSQEQVFSTQFEVKEYVLPSFEVTLEPEEKFLYIDRKENFRVSITAKYLYGKRLTGTAFALFGVMVDEEKKSIPQSLQRIQVALVDGNNQGHLRSDRAVPWGTGSPGPSPGDTAIPVGTAGSDMVEAQRTGIHIVKSPYTIHFTHTPKYFKPGMPFDLTVYVTNPDNSPAPRVRVKAEGFQGLVSTQRDGTAKLVLNMPANKDSITITVTTDQADLPPDRQAKQKMTAEAYKSQGNSGNFLHLAVGASEVQPGDNLPVNFHLKSNNDGVRKSVSYFTYLVALGAVEGFLGAPQPQPCCVPPQLVVKGATEADSRVHEPGTPMRLRIEGDHMAHVGLVAVDKAVFVLSKKNKFTQTKVWDTVEKSDIGCTAGSGRNHIGVFADAGLSLASNVNINTPQRSEVQCEKPAKRKRRSLQLIEYKGQKAAEYTDKNLRKCCEDGMKENLMGYSCEKRAFLSCCTYIKGIREQKQRESYLELARSEMDGGFLDDEDITSRSLFPESWLWQVEELKDISTKTLPVYLKDSITTWEVLAISLSKKKGLCVADPYEITVMKEFFIDLRLPYSVVRNEQVEIRAILYNYWKNKIKVRVELMYNPALCSASTSKARYQQIFDLEPQSSRAVPFVIVPLQLGQHDVEVKAAVWGSFVSDGVKKKLKVVPEGMRLEKTVKIVELDPKTKGHNGVQEVKVTAANITDIVPNTESETKVSIQGNPVSIMVEKAINGEKLKHLIVTPSGCGEQNMIGMTPTVIAVHYLDSTNQWESLGVDRRSESITLIRKGYTQQLAFRKEDSSYAAFTNRQSSTWLTAYVAKVFAMAIKIVDIEPEVVCGAVKWLILEKQKPDGIFQEDAPVIHKEMLGGKLVPEPEVSLTAFVLIALQEARQICKDHVKSLDGSIAKASDYLSRRYLSLARPYTVALTSYALALSGKLDRLGVAPEGNRWVERNSHTYNIEGTSYALLALLQMEKMELTGAVVQWLSQQNYFGGGYGSTQATIMVFQALAQYQVSMPRQQKLNLDVSVLLPRRANAITYRIENSNALVARSAETKLNEDFTVKASGTGKGTMTVVTVYNAKVPEKENKCDNFDLKVDVEDVKMGGLIPVPHRYLDNVDATMSIIDVSMLTGFSPDMQDLKRLSEGVERYISKFEINQVLSDRSNLIIYLDKVSHQAEECIAFRAHQQFQVGLIQPASVTVYSYYKIDDRCTRFYHPDKDGGQLKKICYGDVCRCAEENCFVRQQQDSPITVNQRIERACEPGVDYGETWGTRGRGDGGHVGGSNRTFVSHQQCRDALKLQPGQDYLVWGLASDLWVTGTRFSYLIGKDTWLETWPSEVACQDPELQSLCQAFVEFSEAMTIFGCPS